MSKGYVFVVEGMCPQCGAEHLQDCSGEFIEIYDKFDANFYSHQTRNCRMGPNSGSGIHEHCLLCGTIIRERILPKGRKPRKKESEFIGGYKVFREVTVNGVGYRYFRTKPTEDEIKFIQERMNSPEIVEKDCYLTIWNDVEGRVEVIFGEENIPKDKFCSIHNPNELASSSV